MIPVNFSTAVDTTDAATLPDEMNFAFTGTLTIDRNSYAVTIGQGHQSFSTINNWWIAEPGWKSSNNAVYSPDEKYFFIDHTTIQRTTKLA